MWIILTTFTTDSKRIMRELKYLMFNQKGD